MSAYAVSEQSIHDGVRTRIRDALSVAVQIPGVSFTPPRDSDNRGLPWVRLAVQWTGREAELVYRQRTRGVVILSVFVPIDTGTGALNDLIDDVVEALEAGDMGAVQFERIEVKQSSSASERAGWLQRNVHASFWIDEV